MRPRPDTALLLRRIASDQVASVESLELLLEHLVGIASRLSSERDVSALLQAILQEARLFTGADAGTLYVVEKERLVCKVAQNDTLTGRGTMPPFREFGVPLDPSSLAGACLLSKEILNITDVGKDPRHSPEIGVRLSYPARTMLVIPMYTPKGTPVGVLQLINALDEKGEPEPFSPTWEPMVQALASLAAVSLENRRLYDEIQELFDSFVRYSVRAMDARDPCTAGHSSRVARYSTRIAQELGGFTPATLRELRLAGLLHDIGKIGVREHILTKADKLPPARLSLIRERFEAAGQSARRALLEARVAGRLGEVEATEELARVTAELAGGLETVLRMAGPEPPSEEDLQALPRIARTTYQRLDGQEARLLEDEEVESLSVRRGNLTETERRHIEEHAAFTHDMIRALPFPEELAQVTPFASYHHERLDGGGYPFGLSDDQLPLGARILAVADVYDSLRAEDRPYRRAMSHEQALRVLREEAARGKLDGDVVEALDRACQADGTARKRAPARTDPGAGPPA